MGIDSIILLDTSRLGKCVPAKGLKVRFFSETDKKKKKNERERQGGRKGERDRESG